MTSATGQLAGRHVLVTGAGTGIGRAIAHRLASEGARLALLARDATRLAQTAEVAGASGGEVAFESCDVRDRAQLDAAVARLVANGGELYGAVANSGIGGPNAPATTDVDGPDRFDDLVATNLTGTYNTFRAVERHLSPAAGAHHLLAVSSILARIGVAGYTGYCASKAGILGLVRAFAAELAPANVQVNAICPGWVDTEMAHEGLRGMAAGLGVTKSEAHGIAMQAVPLGRMSAPEDVAGLVNYLLSDDARGVTGQALDMNGGAFMI